MAVSSVQAFFGQKMRSSYAASKHALRAFMDSTRAELGPKSHVKVTIEIIQRGPPTAKATCTKLVSAVRCILIIFPDLISMKYDGNLTPNLSNTQVLMPQASAPTQTLILTVTVTVTLSKPETTREVTTVMPGYIKTGHSEAALNADGSKTGVADANSQKGEDPNKVSGVGVGGTEWDVERERCNP